MRFLFVILLSSLLFCSTFIYIDGCHSAAHGGHYRSPGDNVTYTLENVTENSPEETNLLLGEHNLPQDVIDCVIRNRESVLSRKRRSMVDVTGMLANAGATQEVIDQCQAFLPLCMLTLTCMENVNTSLVESGVGPAAITTTTTAATSTPRQPTVSIIDEPLFPRLPGAIHKMTMYCRLCSKPYCRSYRRCGDWR